MLRITRLGESNGHTLFHLEGRLDAGQLALLDESLVGRSPGEVALDLSDLRWVDGPAAEWLEKLIAAGASLAACSPFIERLLAEKAR